MDTADAARRLVAGGVAGTAAAVLMLPVFDGAKRLGLLSEAPPARVIDRAAAEAEKRPDPAERAGAAFASHLLYGAGVGAAYAALIAPLPRPLPAAIAGPAFGILVWVASYLGWMPAAGVLPRPWRQPAGDALVPVVAHLVYGLALGVGERVLRGDTASR